MTKAKGNMQMKGVPKKVALILISLSTLCSAIPFTYANDMGKKLLPDDNEVNFKYLGAFRFSTQTAGGSRMAYVNGSFAVASQGTTLYAVGHEQHQAIGEFAIPELKVTDKPQNLNMALNIQPFRRILFNNKRLNNSQKLDRISGLEVIEGELFVNAIEYYDAPGDNTLTTFIVRQATNLKEAKVDGLFTLGGRVHSAGWISKLPPEWSKIFGASYLHGYAANYAINSRLSMGPTAFVSYIDNFAGVDEKNGLIPTRALMDFSIKRPMIKDLYNKSKKNNVWTEVSNAYYGFILPKSSQYLVIGNSGGHNSGIGYKAVQKNGHKCDGPCAFDQNDYYNYFWIFDVNDFLKVQDKKIKPWDLKPIKHGKLTLPFAPQNNAKNVIGADFDEVTERLYIMLENVDKSQSRFEAAPVMLVYEMTTSS
jgi:hypothetical protein